METPPIQDENENDVNGAVSTIVAGGLGSPTLLVSQAMPIPISAPQAHEAHSNVVASHDNLPAPPPAHAHSQPASNIDKGLLDAAAYLEGKSMSLPVKTADPGGAGDGSLSWALQNSLLQQYGQLMLDRMLNKPAGDGSSSVTSSEVAAATSQIAAALASQAGQKGDSEAETSLAASSIEAQRDVYRRMLNYSMSSALTQQYYLSQYGYNYLQDRALFTRSDSNQSNTASTSVANQSSASSTTQSRGQLPSIDSVLLNLSTKKTRESVDSKTVAGIVSGATSVNTHAGTSVSTVPAYGLQALANAAIEADPKAFSEAHGTPKEVLSGGHKSELEDISDTDESGLSQSDSSQILSPPRTNYSHMMDTGSHSSIPTAHSHGPSSTFSHNLLSSKASLGTLPGIQHFSALTKQPDLTGTTVQGIKGSEIAGLKVKSEPTEEKELADRAIQEQIAAHHLNAVQQQVQDLTAQTLAAGGIDAAALLAKLPLAAGMEAELQRHIEKMYEYDPDALQALQQEPMELTSDGLPGKIGSRRKSRGRPTSIESQRDPLGRQSSTSSLGANTSYDGDGEDRTYDCDICGKQFSHNDRLRRHRKIHTTEKPYKCDICGKGFKEKCNLKHHRYIHTGEKPYKCETCGKAFNQRSSLKTHQKVHTGEKPFRCELCEKPFAQKYLLRQHMKKHIEIPSHLEIPTQQ